MKRGRILACSMAGAVLATVLLRTFVCTSYSIPSAGMENVLYRGERIVVNKWSYGLRLPCATWFGYHRIWERQPRHKDIIVFNNPGNRTCHTPDRKEAYIGRCVGLPGDTLMVGPDYALGTHDSPWPDQKMLYAYPTRRERQLDAMMRALDIRSYGLMGHDSLRSIRSFSRKEWDALHRAMGDTCWLVPVEGQAVADTCLRPLVVPGRGRDIPVTPWNRVLLCNTLVLHEGRQAELRGDTLYVEGKPAQVCRFTKDYYWVVPASNASNSGSRIYGFVPHDHLIGRAALIWLSKEPGTGLFSGYRWDRMLATIR